MPKSKPPYAAEFKRQIVELHRAGRTVAQLAKEFEPSHWTISKWIEQADADAGRRPDIATSSEKEELTRLRRENRRLQQERDILAKAAAWFARETNSIPSSNS